MTTLQKYEGFLPKFESDPTSALYHTCSSSEKGTPEIQSIALLIDVSGSMYSEISNLKQAILSTVDIILERKLVSLDQIVLITFNRYSKVYYLRNYQHFKQVVYDLDANDCTYYCNAIDELIHLVEKKKQVITVMFSDGEPSEQNYIKSIERLKTIANKESLIFHSIGLNVNGKAERVLRNLTTAGSIEGYYQSIDSTEIVDSMKVLVDHFYGFLEISINGKRTRGGFIVDTETESFDVHLNDKKVIPNVVNESFKEMLENNSFQAVLDAIQFLLEYHLKSLTFDKAISIANHISSLIRETENQIRTAKKDKIIELANEKKVKLDFIAENVGARSLEQRSAIISEYNKKVQNMLNNDTKLLRKVHELKELCAQIQETMLQNHNMSASLSGEIINTISKFRDNSIELERRKLARLSRKVRDGNDKFRNIDQLLQDELNQLIKLDSIPVPKYFEDYSDPITLNDFQDVMLYKYGVFMLLINVERHHYGITAPHKTKIVQVGGFSSSVLEVMMKNEDKSALFDFRGIGFGNAAVPLWISDLHWKKSRHVFGPFVGHAVTGNELEYTKLQGMTLLALILIHLRRLETTEFNQQLIEMVGQTLRQVIYKEKWKSVADSITNSFENLNESKIPSIEVFLVFQEFIGAEFSKDKALLLLAEEFRRKRQKKIQNYFDNLKSSPEDKCNLLVRIFPKVFEKYLNVAVDNISASLNKKSMENYFMSLYNNGNYSRLLKWFDTFSTNLGPSLNNLASSLDSKQKIAIILSVHKCVCFKWEAIDEIPAGLSCDGLYPDLIFGWCKKRMNEKEEKLRAQSNERSLLQILHTKDVAEAETLLRAIKRNSHTWAVMMKILLLSNKIIRPPKLTIDQWENYRVKLYKEQIENMSIPLHFQLLMFCIFNSFKSEDWVPSNMVWRPQILLRRRIKTMFPEAPTIE